MDFEELIGKLKTRLGRPLPGVSAHIPLLAKPVGALRPTFDHRLPPRPGSVLILLYPFNDSIWFPLTKRADYLGAHGGQISLPGGKAEPGEDFIQTALRESREEIELNPDTVEVLGRLSDFFVIPSNFLVTPVIGISRSKPVLEVDHNEVVKILACNLFALIRNDAVKEKEIMAAGRFPMRAPYFEVEGEIVWGATAMMLNELRVIVQEVI
jgi:8-oxo-dGTP pyrophosphatase MutT (NUDIX family)